MNGINIADPTRDSIAQLGASATSDSFTLTLLPDRFNFFLAIGMLLIAFGIWLIRHLFIRRNKIKHQELQHDRRFTIIQGARAIAVVQFPDWLRTTIDFILRVPLPVVVYCLLSAKTLPFVLAGFAASAIFLGYVLFLIIKSLVHRRSIYNRTRLLFREDPMFIRLQLIFSLFRHFMYMALGLTFLFYGIDRIDPNLFIENNTHILLFVAHFQSTLNGMTALGPDYIEGANSAGVFLLSMRTILVFICYTMFAATVTTALTNEKYTYERERRAIQEIAGLLNVYESGESDVFALVALVIERVLGCPSGLVKKESYLHEDLGATATDSAEIQCYLEQIFETGFISDHEASKLKTVSDYVNFLSTPRFVRCERHKDEIDS